MELGRSLLLIDEASLFETFGSFKQLGVCPEFLISKLPKDSNKVASSIRKRLLPSATNKRNKEHQNVLKERNISKNFLSKQLSTIDFYIAKKSTILNNNKLLQKSLYTQQKKYLH